MPELGTEVPFSSVEKALSALFSSDKAVTRASLMNFAIYGEHLDSLDENTALIHEVTREHAYCRESRHGRLESARVGYGPLQCGHGRR
jgi:hypothetical protein